MTHIQFDDQLIVVKEKLYSYALKLTSDPDKALDLLQETYVKALTYRSQFTQNTNLRAWLYTIMKNTFINEYRKNIRNGGLHNGSSEAYQFQNSKDKVYPAPDSYFNSMEIVKSIASLEDEYRIPFTMFIDGYKYKEIAEELDLPLGTVKSRIFFSRKRLEKALAEFV